MANEHMARALRVISVERGHDPRDYGLLCFGGAGGLHACELAELLQVRNVTLPARAGVLSALGMLASEPGRELSTAILEDLAMLDDVRLERGFAGLRQAAAEQLAGEGIAADELGFRSQLELRYLGQSASIVLDYQPGQDHAERFHEAHQAFSGHALERPVELVNLRLSARAKAPLAAFPNPRVQSSSAPEPRQLSLPAEKGETSRMVPVYERRHLRLGQAIEGPAIISEPVATAWLAPGWRAELDEWGSLQLSRA